LKFFYLYILQSCEFDVGDYGVLGIEVGFDVGGYGV
jgi:hypothetical protein